MASFFQVRLTDNTVKLLRAPSAIHHRECLAYLDILQAECADLPPITSDVVDEATESRLLELLKPYYVPMLKCLDKKLDIEDVSWRSRYELFHYGLPVKVEGVEDPLPDLCGFAKLLGHQYKLGDGSSKPPKHTTGDLTLDTIAAILLIFKRKGSWVLESFSLEDAAKIADQANNLLSEQAKELDKKYGNNSPKESGNGATMNPVGSIFPESMQMPEDDPEYSPTFADQLKELGVPLPDGFQD